MKTKDLVLVAFYAALFGVLEYLSVTFGILKMPQGGSISLSAIVLLLASYHLGFKKTQLVVIVSFVIMFMIEPPYILHPIQFLSDYIFAYAAYGIAVLIPDLKVNKLAIPMGVVVANFLRFMFHNISGWVFFSEYYPGNVFMGVMAYNATYMIPTLILSLIVVMLVKPKLEKQF